MSQQTCPQCHAEIVGRFHFCLECGAPLELAQSLTPPPGALSPAQVAPAQSPTPKQQLTPAPFQLDQSEQKEPSTHVNEESASLEKLKFNQAPSPMSRELAPNLVEASPIIHNSNPAPRNPSPVPQASPVPRHPSPVPQASPVPDLTRVKSQSIDYLDLTLIRSPDLDSVRFVVKDHSLIGREEGHLIFKDDPYISPLHATLFYKNNELYIRDEGTYNGVFIRINEPTSLSVGETFIAGEQVFVLEAEPRSITIPCQQTDLATRFFANTSKGLLGFYLAQTLDGGQSGAIYPFIDSSITVGRQGCDVNAPLDRFMSSRHCHVSLMGDDVVLTDTGSKNGTFVKIQGERRLRVGDYILIGKQLLQVQPHQPGSRSKVAI